MRGAMCEAVTVTYEDSPIHVLSSGGATHEYRLQMPGGISAIETFPATSNTGRYVLTLSKPVAFPGVVLSVRDELLAFLRELSVVWPFSGASRLTLHNGTISYAPRYTTNADEVLSRLLARQGATRFSQTINLQYTVAGAYNQFPLCLAYPLVIAVRGDVFLRLMLDYYSQAISDVRSWYVHLYKIRDTLEHAAKKLGRPGFRFGISRARWSRFGHLLNDEYDLRHAPAVADSIPSISLTDRDQVFEIGRQMVTAYMDSLSIPHA